MGKVNQQFQDKVNKICDDYINGFITKDEAVYRLVQLGEDPKEAQDNLDTIYEKEQLK